MTPQFRDGELEPDERIIPQSFPLYRAYCWIDPAERGAGPSESLVHVLSSAAPVIGWVECGCRQAHGEGGKPRDQRCRELAPVVPSPSGSVDGCGVTYASVGLVRAYGSTPEEAVLQAAGLADAIWALPDAAETDQA